MKEFHCGVDVIYSTWVTVEAETEEKAIELAIEVAKDNTNNPAPCTGTDVHWIDEVGDDDEPVDDDEPTPYQMNAELRSAGY